MRKSALLITGLVMVAIFAGCIGGEKETAAPVVTTAAPAPVETKPPTRLEVGVYSISKGKSTGEVTFTRPDEATTAPWYCGSGQTDTKFIPVSMSVKGYVDVWDKAKLQASDSGALDHRVWLHGAVGNGDFGTDYKFYHGTDTIDGTKMLISANRIGPDGFTGNIDLYYLDMADLVAGKVNVLQENRITGNPKTTITFRQFFTNDGKYLLQSGADIFFLVDAETLEVVDQQGDLAGENHDAMPTPDDKYAILTVRTPTDDPKVKDGALQLYDIEAKELVGGAVSVCDDCHASMGIKGSAILCGIDGTLEEADGKYTGTLYIAGHGGHFGEATVTIDPTATDPISVTLAKRDICSSPPCGGEYKFHDARIDGDNIWWSTYK